jgi:DNA-directed RNA polymerase subunit K/omega
MIRGLIFNNPKEERMKTNKYQQVIIASKFARTLNSRLRDDRPEWQPEGAEAEKKVVRPSSKIVDQALKCLAEGKIEYAEQGKE